MRFGVAQLEAGADALCLADHATRDICSPNAYREFLLDIHQELRDRIPCPLMLHICGDTVGPHSLYPRDGPGLLPLRFEGPDRQGPRAGRRAPRPHGRDQQLRHHPHGTPETIRADVAEKIACHIDIIGPECAVPLNAPDENMRLLVEEVHRQSGE